MIQELQTGILDINNKYDIDFSCKQLDDIILKIIVYDKSLSADLSNYNVRLKAFKADQVPLVQNTNITIIDNVVIIKASKQLTTTQGTVKAELQFINKTTLEKKSTFYLEIEVVASVLDVDGTVSTPTCTILEEIDHKLDQIENIGQVLDEAKEVRDTLTNTTIPAGSSINSKLEANTKNASTKITEVENIITDASNKIEEVETSVNNANTCKKELDNSSTIATTNKENLDAANALAKENIEELNKIGDAKDLAAKVETNTTDITKLKTDVEDNTSQLKDCAKNISQLSNSNLLINGYFINSVNQRNMKTYEWKSGGLYTLDRWHLAYGGNITLNDEGVIFDTQSSPNVSCELRQVIENSKYYIRGKDVTLSLKYKVSYVYSGETCGQLALYSRLTGSSSRVENLNFDGEWHTITFTVKEDLLSNDDGTKESIFIIRAKNIKIELEWAKLELGSVVTPLVSRSYGEELALCQRYYQVIKAGQAHPLTFWFDNNLDFLIPLSTPMRINPSVSIPGGKSISVKNFDTNTTFADATLVGSVGNPTNGNSLNLRLSKPNNGVKNGACWGNGFDISLDSEIY